MNKKIKKGCGCLFGAVLLLLVIGAVTLYVLKPKWHDDYGQRFTDIAYGSREHNTYDLHLPVDAALKDSLALILYVHGGSWIGGDKNEHHGDCYKWVQRGYATATMNYSLLNEGGVSLLTMLEEIDACIRHIEQFAAGKGVHIQQMAIRSDQPIFAFCSHITVMPRRRMWRISCSVARENALTALPSLANNSTASS